MESNNYDFSSPRKQSATGIIFMFLNTLQKLIRNLAIPLLVIIFRSDTSSRSYIFLGMCIVVLLVAVFAYFRYQSFTFYINEKDDAFVINEGVFVKTSLTIHLDKIQQVNINQSFLQRIIGFYTLQIDTAGSDKKEGTIRAIDKTSAEELKKKLLNRDNRPELQKEMSSAELSNEPIVTTPFLKLSPLTLLKIGATSNYGQTIALVIAFLAAGFQSLKDIIDIFEVDRDQVGQAFQQGITLISIGIMISGVLIFLLVLNIIRTFIKYFDFEVFKQKNSLVVNSGLLAKKNTFLNPHRVQISVYTQNYFQKKLNMLDMRMKQNSTVTQSNKETKNSDIEIPGCSSKERDQILTMIFNEVPKEGLKLSPNYRFVFLSIVFWIIVPFLILLTLNNWRYPMLDYVPYFVAYAILAATMIYYRFRNHRLFVSGEYIIKQHGIWDIERQIIVPHKIQAMTIKQMLWHRKANIGYITCHTAAGNITFRFGNYDTLQMLMNYWLYQVESSEKDWM
ncbi:MAG: PH domain-containing protein [Pedobacter sp.]